MAVFKFVLSLEISFCEFIHRFNLRHGSQDHEKKVPLSNVPKQLKVADRGYEVFPQESKRTSTPGGSRKHLARIREEEAKKAEGNQGLFINCYFYCSIMMFVSDKKISFKIMRNEL